MQAFVIITAATVTLTLENVASAGTFECEADHQCKSGYCYRDTGYCAPCLDCAEYLRQNPQWPTCPREPRDCGACLAGYENEYLAGGTVRNFCVPTRTLAADVVNERSPYFWPLVGCGVLLLVIVFVLTIRKYRVYKTRRDAHSSNPDAEDPPPPVDNEYASPPPSYDSSIPLLVRNSVVSSALVTSLTVVEKDENNLPQAVPFTRPHPPYGNGGEAEYGDDEEIEFVEMDQLENSVNEDEIHRVPSPPQLEDEDTMPSEWIPDACFRNRQPPSPASVSSPQDLNVPCEEPSSSTSSLSDLSNEDVDVIPAACAQVLNDSGVSASCSQQSDLSSSANVETCAHVLENSQNTTTNSVHSVLERYRSDEDMSTLAEMRANKRQRCDSGSSSMKSLEPF